jgi:beta-lactamase regulating signal transducer with metallopeptidase domain
MQALSFQLPSLLKMSAQASILILLVLAAQRLCGQRLLPRWRCALWLLVLLRLALPWTIPSPASLFNVLKFPAATRHAPALTGPVPVMDAPTSYDTGDAAAVTTASANWLAWLWAAGALGLAGCAAVNHYRIHRRVTRRRPLIDAPTLNLLEDCKALMGVRAPVTLIETETVQSPSLFGFVRPRLLLPTGLTAGFSRDELRHVFLHELAHIKRHDILAGWLMLVLQTLHWFNPLVWLAFYRLRADREVACDALALSHARAGENESYGLTVVKLLEGFGGSAWAPSLAGILENKQQMKDRINMIAKFHKTDRGLALAVSLLAGLGVATLTDAQNAGNAAAPSDPDGPPRIVATSPAVGATDVDPAIGEITVTFDRDMKGGYSFTGKSRPDFPPLLEPDAKPKWRDQRTCVLPVQLEAAHYYRVGINSTNFQNFRSLRGVPAVPSVICFTTQGASEELKQKVQVPRIVSMTPANGAQDVSPAATELRVTFNVPMGGGYSWCGNGPRYPANPEGERPHWTEDHKTCVLPVELKPNWRYELSLNAERFKNFASQGGVPLEPVAYTFKTTEK